VVLGFRRGDGETGTARMVATEARVTGPRRSSQPRAPGFRDTESASETETEALTGTGSEKQSLEDYPMDQGPPVEA